MYHLNMVLKKSCFFDDIFIVNSYAVTVLSSKSAYIFLQYDGEFLTILLHYSLQVLIVFLRWRWCQISVPMSFIVQTVARRWTR